MAACACGGQLRPLGGQWTCTTCGTRGGHVRPFRRLRVDERQWFRSFAYRQAMLDEARDWATQKCGTVVVQVYRRPELRLATIQAFP